MVVVPKDESVSGEEQINRIRARFSDDVEVKSVDESSGVITPVFRERTGDDYFYVLVPVQSGQ